MHPTPKSFFDKLLGFITPQVILVPLWFPCGYHAERAMLPPMIYIPRCVPGAFLREVGGRYLPAC